LIVLLIALPWLALITWKSHGAFLQQAVGKDMLGKVASGEESHGIPPGFYVLTYSLFMWPFGLIAVGAGLQALNRLRDDPRLRFCLAWYNPVLAGVRADSDQVAALCAAGLSRHGAAGRLASDPAAGGRQCAAQALAVMALVVDRLRSWLGQYRSGRFLGWGADLSRQGILVVEHSGRTCRARHRLSRLSPPFAGAAPPHRRDRGRRRHHPWLAVRDDCPRR